MNRKSEGPRTSQYELSKSALKSKKSESVAKAFQQLDANPDFSRKEHLLHIAIQDAKIDGINTGIPLGAPEEERLAAYQRIYKFQLRRDLGLSADAADSDVAKAMNREINRAISELQGSEEKTTERRERQFLGVSEQASQEELVGARKQPTKNERRRLGLADNTSAEQLDETVARLREEALRIYLGLPLNAPEADVNRAAEEDKALYEDTPAEDCRLLLGLASICADAALDEAMHLAAKSRMERFNATNERQLTEARTAAAQRARRHTLGLAEDACENDIAMADCEAVYTLRRRNLDLAEDCSAWSLEQASKQRLNTPPLAISPLMS